MSTASGLSPVSCPCGASLKVDSDAPSTETSCPECGMVLLLLVTTDPRTRQKRVGIVVKPAAVTPRRGKQKGGAEEEVHTAKCTCGAQVTIVRGDMGAVYTCDACGADYTALFKQTRSGGMTTLMLRPLIASPATKATRKATRVPPPAKKPPTHRFKVVAPAAAPAAAIAAREKMLLMSKGKIGVQEVTEDDGKSLIACFCGTALGLRDGFHREILKCAECGAAYRIFAATNPRTSAAMVVMIPREGGK